MLSFLNRLSVRNRIWAIVVVLMSGVVLCSVIDVLMLREALWRDKEEKTRHLVDAGFGVLSHLYEQQNSGEISQATAQTAAIGIIRAMRYDDKEYFWLNDLGTPYPKMIMHPTVSSLDGQLLDSDQFNCATSLRVGSEGEFKETNGRLNIFLAFAEVINQGGAGYVAYRWPKPQAGAKVTQERFPKLSYVRKFEPWGWVIGTGIYVDDVEIAVRTQIQRNILLVTGVGLVVLLMAALLAHSITRPLRQTIRIMRAIDGGQDDLAQRLPVDGHSEIAELANGFNDMLGRLAVRDAELAQHRAELEDDVARRTAELRDANSNLAHELAEHRLAEQALKESEAQFNSISATAQDAIIMVSDCCRITYWNPAAERIFGHRYDEVLGCDLHDLLAPPRFRDAFRRGFEQFRLSGEGPAVNKTVELVGLRRDGSEFPMELSISAVRRQGHWSAVGFVRDISERKQSEQKIRENQRRMRALIDATSESVMLLDPDGQILAINTFAARRFGKSPEEMKGIEFFSLLPPELAASRESAVQHCFNVGEPLNIQDKRGNIFFDNSLYPVMDEAGTVESVAVFAKDVTEQHRIKEIESVFRHLDMSLLRWQMDLESIAQIFCDDILPVLDLAAIWIGRAEKDGKVTLIASTEGNNSGLLAPLQVNDLRWDGETSASALPVGVVISTGQRQIVSLGDRGDTSDARCAILLPLVLRGENWGVLTLYGKVSHQFNEMQLSVTVGAIANRLSAAFDAALKQEWLTLLETALASVDNAVFITDDSTRIIWANQALVQLSGYASDAIIGQTPKLFVSGEHSDGSYKQLWETVTQGGQWHGELINARADGLRYTVTQRVTPLRNTYGNVSHYVAILEDISERKSAEERIQYLAHFDLLTDLPNRGLFLDRLGQALAISRREGTEVALLFLDLDRFKVVNDELGHAAGDALLVSFARRLRELVRECDTVARLAGDEFTIILPGLCDSNDATVVAEKILNAMSQAFTIADQQLTVGVSIGLAIFPCDGDSIEHLLNAADHAMYQAKNMGRNCYAHAACEMDRATKDK